MRLVPYIASGIAFAAWACAPACHATETEWLDEPAARGSSTSRDGHGDREAGLSLSLRLRPVTTNFAAINFGKPDSLSSTELNTVGVAVPFEPGTGTTFGFWTGFLALVAAAGLHCASRHGRSVITSSHAVSGRRSGPLFGALRASDARSRG